MPRIVKNSVGRAAGTSRAQAEGRVIVAETWLAAVSAGVGALATPGITTTVVQNINVTNIGQVTGDVAVGSGAAESVKETPMHPYFNRLLIAALAIIVLAALGSGYIALFIDQPTDPQKELMRALLHVATGGAMGVIGFFGGRFAP